MDGPVVAGAAEVADLTPLKVLVAGVGFVVGGAVVLRLKIQMRISP